MNNAFSSDNSLDVYSTGSSSPCSIVLDDMRAIEGDVRFNNGYFEVYASGMWQMISDGTTDVRLHYEDKEAIEWAKKKMQEEEKEKELLNKYPSLKIAKEKYDTIKALVEK